MPKYWGGGELFRTREIPRSGSKAKDGEKRKKKERVKVGDNNGHAIMHGARKPPGPKKQGSPFLLHTVEISYLLFLTSPPPSSSLPCHTLYCVTL